MPTFMTFILRVFLLVAGLVFAASLAVAAVLMLAVWSVRAGWAKLTGRPLAPFIVRIDPRGGFERMYRRGGPASAARADSVRPPRNVADVTDVEPKAPRG
ncbi:MAG: hypothetical protein Q8R33_24385 [Burkholderiales bacterium]|nr:hypothetical protein [Burkholderiales bacterium]